MDAVLDIASGVFLLTGSIFAVIGGIGLLRLPDFFARIHGAGITDTMGAGMVLGGLMLAADDWMAVIKLVAILFFLLLTSPTSAHALSNAALAVGLRPELADKEKGRSPS
jgi:multicomponent Na+:H+ antiporter subunit G